MLFIHFITYLHIQKSFLQTSWSWAYRSTCGPSSSGLPPDHYARFEDPSKAGVDENLDSLHCSGGGSPGLHSVQQDRLHNSIEEPDLSVDAYLHLLLGVREKGQDIGKVEIIHNVHRMPFRFWAEDVFITQSIAKRNRKGDSKQSFLTPVCTRNSWVACHELSCSSSLHKSFWSCLWSFLALFRGSVYPYQMPSYSHWNWYTEESSTLATAPRWYAMLQSGQCMTCPYENQLVGLRVGGLFNLSSCSAALGWTHFLR